MRIGHREIKGKTLELPKARRRKIRAPFRVHAVPAIHVPQWIELHYEILCRRNDIAGQGDPIEMYDRNAAAALQNTESL